MKVAMFAENADETRLPDCKARNRAAVDELMSRQMDVIVCHPSRAAAARRDAWIDPPAEEPIVILTESAGAAGAMTLAAASPAASAATSPTASPAPHPATMAAAPGCAPALSTPRAATGRLWHDLAVSLAQEIRAPLTLIGEYCSLVRDGLTGAVSAEQSNCLALLTGQVDDVTATIQSICRLADLERGLLRPAPSAHNLREAIARVSPGLARKAALRGITLDAAEPRDLPEVYCDLELLDGTLTMLAGEVAKTAPAGGTLRIEAQLRSAGAEVVVSVYLVDDPDAPRQGAAAESAAESPSGAGGEPPVAGPAGESLRLAMTRDLAQRNLGESRPRARGGGFEFTLPLADPEVVVARYIQARRPRLTAARWICLVSLELDAPGESGLVAAVEGAIHDATHGEHLLFRLDGDRWLLVVEREDSDQDSLVEEFRRGWAERRRHHRSLGQGRPRRLPLVRPTLNAMYQILPGGPDGAARSAIPGAVPLEGPLEGGVECPATAPDASPAAPAVAHKPRVLVVDDEPNLVQALRMRLTLSGFDVLTAADGQAGLSTAIAARPQLVVLDIRMPKLDGLTVLDRLREHDDTKAIPVIIVSASHIDRRSALQRGARYFLEKPYDSQVLMTTIRAALSDPAVGGGSAT